jgi:hypothetical protein
MERVGIRNAETGDAEQVGCLMTELGYPTTVEAMTDRLAMILADPNYVTFVADEGYGVIGVAGATLGWYYEKDGMYAPIARRCRFIDGAGTRHRQSARRSG